MIAIDTSVLIAIMLDETEADLFKSVLRDEPSILVSWPTLFETRIVLAAKGFSSPDDIISRFHSAPNVTSVAFDEKHYRAAEQALEQFGKGRHFAGLNMGDCFSYAVSKVSGAPLLFKGSDFSKTDLKLHPASAVI